MIHRRLLLLIRIRFIVIITVLVLIVHLQLLSVLFIPNVLVVSASPSIISSDYVSTEDITTTIMSETSDHHHHRIIADTKTTDDDVQDYDDDNAAAADDDNNDDDDNDDDEAVSATTISKGTYNAMEGSSSNSLQNKKSISMAFCGNSMLYFNDSPRLLELIITLRNIIMIDEEKQRLSSYNNNVDVTTTTTTTPNTVVVYQNSCLRGGATLSSLYTHGNGMTTKFHTYPATIQLSDILPQILSQVSTITITQQQQEEEDKTVTPTSTTSTVVSSTILPTVGTGFDTITAASTTKRYHDYYDDTSHSTKKLHYDIGAHTVQQLLQQQSYDYIILNDYTQGPARHDSRVRTQHTIRTKYVPHIQSPQTTTIIILQTPAYEKVGIKDSHDLGTFEEFTTKLKEGVISYVETIQDMKLFERVVYAPVGDAYLYLYYNNRTLYHKLYSWDHYHPSPYGTWLQVCILYNIMFDTCLTSTMLSYHDSYWYYSRYMQPVDEDLLPKPSLEEAQELQRVACIITNTEFNNNNNNNSGDGGG